ncbi:MAG: polysaccharide deacetylase family protein [Roseburia hominis]
MSRQPFFVVGKEDEASAAIYQRIVDEGHTLGMHSYSNKYSLIYQSEDAFEADFHQLQDYLYEVTGEKSRYYRFPGGSSNQISNVPMSSLIRFFKQRGRRLLRLEHLGRRCGKCCIYIGRTGRECCFRCFKIQDLGCAFARLGR